MKPLKSNVLVKPDAEKEVEGGIFLAKKNIEKPQMGTIVSIGEQVTEVKEGDRIFFGKYTGNSLINNNEKFLIMDEEDILAIIE